MFDLFKNKKHNSREANVSMVTTDSSRTQSFVEPENIPHYKKRGWTQKGNKYSGYYRTRFGAYKGEIERRGDKFNVLIHKPPTRELKRHPRWPCFHKKNKGWYMINLAKQPANRDISALVLRVELIILEAYRIQ